MSAQWTTISSTSSYPSSTTGTTTSSAATSETSYPPLDGPSAQCPGDDGKVATVDGQAYVLECYVDRSDSDIGLVYVATWYECITACSGTPGCVDISFVPPPMGARHLEPCYLKNGAGYPNQNPNVWGGMLVSGVPATTSATSTATGPTISTTPAVTCPDNDGEVVTFNDRSFVLRCGIDRSGGDLGEGSPIYDTTYMGCVEACADNPNCMDISFLGTACYLKGELRPEEYNPAVFGAELINSGASGAATATNTEASPSPTETDGTPTASVITPRDTIACPNNDGALYQSECGAQYVIDCYVDRADSDIAGNPHYVSSLNECISTCDNTNTCIALSWSPGTPGPCYLKSEFSTPVQDQGIWGATQIRDCTDMHWRKRNTLQGPVGDNNGDDLAVSQSFSPRGGSIAQRAVALLPNSKLRKLFSVKRVLPRAPVANLIPADPVYVSYPIESRSAELVSTDPSSGEIFDFVRDKWSKRDDEDSEDPEDRMHKRHEDDDDDKDWEKKMEKRTAKEEHAYAARTPSHAAYSPLPSMEIVKRAAPTFSKRANETEETENTDDMEAYKDEGEFFPIPGLGFGRFGPPHFTLVPGRNPWGGIGARTHTTTTVTAYTTLAPVSVMASTTTTTLHTAGAHTVTATVYTTATSTVVATYSPVCTTPTPLAY